MAHVVNMSSAAIAQIANALDQYEEFLKRQQGMIVTDFESLRQENHWNDQNADRFGSGQMSALADDFAGLYRKIHEIHPVLAHLYQRLRAYEQQA